MYPVEGSFLLNQESDLQFFNGIQVLSPSSLDINISSPVSLSIVSGKRNAREIWEHKNERSKIVSTDFTNEFIMAKLTNMKADIFEYLRIQCT